MTQMYGRSLLAFLLAGLAGCHGTEPPTETSEPEASVATTVTISPRVLTFSWMGETQQLTATVRDQYGVTINGGELDVSLWRSVSTGFTGFVLLWMRERTGSLVVPVLYHNVFNIAQALV